MTPGGPGSSGESGWYGPPTGDPLAARLFPPLPGTVQWGLDRMHRILAAVGSPHRAYPSLVVGGTNGKGSVATVWARVLQAAGFRTGLYTSPHLVHFRERIQVDGVPLPDLFLEEVAEGLRSPILKRQPSFFEATTALALSAFARAGVEVAILEVGVGGRLDAVNIVDPILTAITNVELDHQNWLGADHAAIAREKAGIFRAGVPAFTATRHPDALTVLAEEAASLGLPLSRVAEAPGESTLEGLRPGTHLRLRTRSWGELELHSPLLGAHQRTNVALAVRALEGLPPRLIPRRQAVVDGVAAARVPGRLQHEREGSRHFLLDVAHNPAGVETLARALRELHAPAPRVGVVGILRDKPWDAMLRILDPQLDHLVLVVPPGAPPERRWDPEAARASLAGFRDPARPVEVALSMGDALLRARKAAGTEGTVVVTGSFHTVGAALVELEARRTPEGTPAPAPAP